MNDTFTNWLYSGDTNPCYLNRRMDTLIIIRLEKNKNFDYLFCQENYNYSGISDNPFQYVGIYCKQNISLYDIQRKLKDIVGNFESMEDKSKKSLLEQLKETFRHKVEDFINNDRNNLQITELKNSELLERLKETEVDARKSACKFYFDDRSIIYRCFYIKHDWEEDSLLEYILDPDNYAQKEAETYISKHQEDILYSLLCNDMIRKEYETILKDTKNPVHIIKKIRDAMNNTSAKTVNITILKNDIEFTFKAEVNYLRGFPEDSYKPYNLISKDRKRFEQIFGILKGYKPQEILRITYGKKVLYELNK